MKKFFMPVFLVILLASTAFCEDAANTTKEFKNATITDSDNTSTSLTSPSLEDCTINFGNSSNFQLADGAEILINGTVTVNSFAQPLFNLHGSATFSGTGKIILKSDKALINEAVYSSSANYIAGTVSISGVTIENKASKQTITLSGSSLKLENGANIVYPSNTSSCVQLQNGGTFSMEDGCSLDGGETALVLWNGANATMTGGTIKGNSYGVRFNTSGSLTMTGGTISGGKYGICYGKSGATPSASATVTLGNSATVGEGNIHIGGGNTITIQDGWTGSAGVTTATAPTSDSPIAVTDTSGKNMSVMKTSSSDYPNFTKQLYLGTPTTGGGGYGANGDYGIRMKSDGTVQIVTHSTSW